MLDRNHHKRLLEPQTHQGHCSQMQKTLPSARVPAHSCELSSGLRPCDWLTCVQGGCFKRLIYLCLVSLSSSSLPQHLWMHPQCTAHRSAVLCGPLDRQPSFLGYSGQLLCRLTGSSDVLLGAGWLGTLTPHSTKLPGWPDGERWPR